MPEYSYLRIRCEEPQQRFLDQLLAALQRNGHDVTTHQDVVEEALKALGKRYKLESPPSLPGRGGAMPGAGRPKKS